MTKYFEFLTNQTAWPVQRLDNYNINIEKIKPFLFLLEIRQLCGIIEK